MSLNGIEIMEEAIPPTNAALKEALSQSSEILKNIELDEISLTNIALKSSRLARLLNDYDVQKIMEFEVRGYPSQPVGLPPDIFQLAVKAERVIKQRDENSGYIRELAYIESIAEWEHIVATAEKAIEAAREQDISITSANPYQTVVPPLGHSIERSNIRTNATLATKKIADRRSYIYAYALRKYYELKFSDIANDIFSRTRALVDSNIGKYVPEAIKKLTAIHDNLKSNNPEDWSNVVHSCRRMLIMLADEIYPPQENKIKTVEGKSITIKLGKDNYINRLVSFIEEQGKSNRFKHIVGSHLSFIGDRLDSIVGAAQKGSHDIVSQQEADRYVIYTYMIVGDILPLLEDTEG